MSTFSEPQPRLHLADAFVGRRSVAIDVTLIAAGALIVAALAQVSIPLWPVPITGQTLGVIVVGSSLGARRGAASMLLYLLAGLAGLPVFAGFAGGPSSVLLPSFGFIIGFVFSAMVAGWLAERQWDRRFWLALAGFAIASAIPFIVGVPYLSWRLSAMGLNGGFGAAMDAGVYPFIVGGIVKALLAAAIVPLSWKAVRLIDARNGNNRHDRTSKRTFN